MAEWSVLPFDNGLVVEINGSRSQIRYYDASAERANRMQALALIACVTTVVAAQANRRRLAPSDVLHLDSTNFTKTVDAAGARTLVFFYLPFCGFCQSFAPAFAAASQQVAAYSRADPTLVGRFAKVDAEVEWYIASSHGAPKSKGYPSLWWFADGEYTKYNGGRSSADLVDLVIRRGGPLVANLPNASAQEAFRLSYPIAVVATLSKDKNGKAARRVVESVCKATPEARCGELVPDKKAKVKSSTVVLYRATDDAAVTYDGSLAATEELRRFVVANLLEPVVEYGPATRSQLFDSEINLLVLLLVRGETVNGMVWRNAFAEAAESLRAEAIFVTVDVSASHGKSLLQFLRIDEKSNSSLPALALYDKGAHVRYAFDTAKQAEEGRRAWPSMRVGRRRLLVPQAPTAEAIAAFVRSAIDGVATPSLLSEAPTGDKTKRAATELVGSTYQSTVLRSEPRRDCLILFHAPWCTDCDGLMEAFDQLAEAQEDVLVATLDVGSNEVPAPKLLHGVPEVVLVRADAKSLEGRRYDTMGAI